LSKTTAKDTVFFFLVILAAYVLTFGGHIYSPDAEVQFRTTQAIAASATTAIEPLGGFSTMKGRGDLEYAQYGVGMPILAAPFYFLGELFDKTISDYFVHRTFWPTSQYHGSTSRDWRLRLGVSLFNPVVSALLATLFFVLMTRVGLSRGEAWMAGLLNALGTLSWAHSRTFFSEPAAALLIFASFLLVYFWLQGGAKGLVKPLAAGLLAGYAVLVRKDSALFYPGLCLFAMLPIVLRGGILDEEGSDDISEGACCWRPDLIKR